MNNGTAFKIYVVSCVVVLALFFYGVVLSVI